VTRQELLASCALPFALGMATMSHAQNLQTPPVASPPPSAVETPGSDDQVQFTADGLEYEDKTDIVTAKGDVRMYRAGNRLRADQVVWNRATGKVLATGNIAVTNPQGDIAYGDSMDLTDTLKDGVIENMLVVLQQGNGRLAARRGTRKDGIITLDDGAYTPCNVLASPNCPKNPTWKITAVRVVYDPDTKRVKYTGAHFDMFGLGLPLPAFSHPVGDQSDSGFLTPNVRYNGSNGLSVAAPYYFNLGTNRGLTVTPQVFSKALPMIGAEYKSLWEQGAYQIAAYGTYSRRSDDVLIGTTTSDLSSKQAFRGYIDGIGRFQLNENWSISGSVRLTTDDTFLRRYEISGDDRLRNTVKIERIDKDSYFSISSWVVQTLGTGDKQGLQPIALPAIDYRKRFGEDVFGGRFLLQLNSLAITRTEGQDTQRAFAALTWELRKITSLGQELTLTGYARADAYNTDDTLATTVAAYRGLDGFRGRAMGTVAADMKWPFIGEFLGGTQRFTPRIQLAYTPHVANLDVPNEDSRAIDLEDSNLFALNRFPGYDRVEDGPRVTYGVDWALDRPGLAISANVGQSYQLNSTPSLFPDGTGLSDRLSDIVGRTEVRIADIFSLTHRYRLDKNDFAVRVNELDATIGSRSTYLLVGYLGLNRNIASTLEDLQDRKELRVAGRIHFKKYWSLFGSATIDLTSSAQDQLNLSDGFDPVRHRLGLAYEDECLRLGLTWKRDYQTTGDAKGGNSFMLTLSFKNLGR